MYFDGFKNKKQIFLIFYYFFFFNYIAKNNQNKFINNFCIFKLNVSSSYMISKNLILKNNKKYINFFPKKIKERVFGDLFLRFLESFFGAKVLFFFVRNLWVHFNSYVLIQESIFSKRILQYSNLAFKKKRGHWWWGSKILALAVGLKDPTLLVSWLQTRLRFMNLYAHRRFFRLLGLLLSNLARIDNLYAFRGFYMRLVGKISVVGNAMSRSWWTRGGFASGSNLNLQLFYAFTIVRTTTGCLGLTLYFFY